MGKSLLVAAQDNLKKLSLELGGKVACYSFLMMQTWTKQFQEPRKRYSPMRGKSVSLDHGFSYKRAFTAMLLTGSKQLLSPFKLGPCLDTANPNGSLDFRSTTPARSCPCGKKSQRKAQGLSQVGRVREPSTGFFYQPTIFADVTSNPCRSITNEVFGPVLAITPFKNLQDALQESK